MKNFIPARFHKYFRPARLRQTVSLIVVVAAVAIAGTILLVVSHAATSVTSVEAESGTRTGAVTQVADSNAAGGAAVKFGSTASGSLFLNGVFPIGVFVQPSSNFNLWKNRGINTLTAVPDGTNTDTWATAADQAGLYQIRTQRTNTALDASDQWLLAYAQPDEPDGIFSQVSISQIHTNYLNFKAINSNLPVYINFTGGLNQFDVTGACSDKVYRSSCASGDSWYSQYVANADWISGDTYPVNNGGGLNQVGQMVDHLRSLAGTKPVFAFIETSDYDTTNGNPGPTAAQFRGELWSAIIHGVRGVWYFPELISPSFSFDATPAAVVTEMTTQHTTITQLASVLQGPINPAGISASAASPLEVAWRSSAGHSYFFVLNLSNTTISPTVTLSGIGAASTATVYGESRSVTISASKITDSFGPYAVHIYQVN